MIELDSLPYNNPLQYWNTSTMHPGSNHVTANAHWIALTLSEVSFDHFQLVTKEGWWWYMQFFNGGMTLI